MLLLLSMVLLSLLMLLKRIELPTIYNFVKQQQMKEVGLMLKKAESHNFFSFNYRWGFSKNDVVAAVLVVVVVVGDDFKP